MRVSAADVGRLLGVSEWTRLSQAEIDDFGRATRNVAAFHMDPEWAGRNSPYGGTVAYGFQTLSLLTYFNHEILDWPAGGEGGNGYALNYGLDRVRFIAPVPVEARFRCRLWLTAIEPKGAGRELRTFKAEIEVEGQARPALVADWIGLWIAEDAAAGQHDGVV